jgi:hypothetical protein
MPADSWQMRPHPPKSSLKPAAAAAEQLPLPLLLRLGMQRALDGLWLEYCHVVK